METMSMKRRRELCSGERRRGVEERKRERERGGDRKKEEK